MSRAARKLSESGIYHVMLRGNDRQKVFLEEEDRQYWISLLNRYKSVSQFELYAYCLMGNHVHMLLRTGAEPLEKVFRRLGSAFVYWYNLKYDRVGHLFQDRFRSEAVEDDGYFLGVLRYILQNPVKAKLCEQPEDYPYSSAREYLCGASGITDTGFAEGLLDREALAAFIREKSQDQYLELPEKSRPRVTDQAASVQITEKLGVWSPERLKEDRGQLYAAIREMTAGGISIRQLNRLSGIPKSVIERALKQQDREPSPVLENRPLSWEGEHEHT